MGSVNATAKSGVVLPEVILRSKGRVLLVHGVENGREFWWPPGAYWLCEKACVLSLEQPQDWVRRVIGEQVGLAVGGIRLLSVEHFGPGHPPVLIFEAEGEGTPAPSARHGFDTAQYFPGAELPANLGRDDLHGAWLRGLLDRLQPALSA